MLITPQEWIDRRFGDAQKKPTATSVRRWIENGDLPGEKIGGRWFVEVDSTKITTGNDLADRVLRAG